MSGPFYVSTEVEHACCWTHSIRCKVPMGTGEYGEDELIVVETYEAWAQWICDALNAAHARGDLSANLAKLLAS